MAKRSNSWVKWKYENVSPSKILSVYMWGICRGQLKLWCDLLRFYSIVNIRFCTRFPFLFFSDFSAGSKDGKHQSSNLSGRIFRVTRKHPTCLWLSLWNLIDLFIRKEHESSSQDRLKQLWVNAPEKTPHPTFPETKISYLHCTEKKILDAHNVWIYLACFLHRLFVYLKPAP